MIRFLLIGLAALFFAARTFAMKMVSTSTPPEEALFLQCVASLIVVSPFFLSALRSMTAETMTPQFLRALSFGGMLFLSYVIVRDLHTIHVTLMSNWTPLFMPFLALLWLRKGFSPLVAFGLLLGWIGIVLTLFPETQGPFSLRIIGLAMGLLGGLALLMNCELCNKAPPTATLFFTYAILTPLLLCVAFWRWVAPLPIDWAYLAGIGILNVAIDLLFLTSNRRGCFYPLHPFFYIALIFSALIDYFVWNYIPSIFFQVGTMIVVIGCWLILALFRENTSSSR